MNFGRRHIPCYHACYLEFVDVPVVYPKDSVPGVQALSDWTKIEIICFEIEHIN